MAILKKGNKQNFTVVDNNIFKNKNLSLKDIGLLCFLLSLPENWEFSENGLLKILEKDGQTAIRTALKNLEREKYLTRKQERNGKGHIIGVEWIVFGCPNINENSSQYILSDKRIKKSFAQFLKDVESISDLESIIKEIKYKNFLKTNYWIIIANQKKKQANYKCQFCGSNKNLQVHHLTYENHGNEHLKDVMNEDLIVLCKECHKKQHDL